MTRSNDPNSNNYVKLLVKLGMMYGANQTDPSQFQLFNTSAKYGERNVLFKDNAVGLEEVTKTYYRDYLSEERFLHESDIVSCTDPPPRPTTLPSTTTSTSNSTSNSTSTSAVSSTSPQVALLLTAIIVFLVKAF